MKTYLKYSLGIDLSKAKFDVCLSIIDSTQHVSIKGSRKFSNTAEGFKSFLSWTKAHYKEDIPMVFIMEATGVYFERLAFRLYQEGYKVVVVLANKAKKYIQSIGYKSKTDKIDAQALAQMGAEQNLPLWQPYSKEIYTLRSLTRQNEDLQKERTIILNRIEAISFAQVKSSLILKQLKASLRLIEKQILELKDEIERCIDQDDVLSSKVKKIQSIKGLGLITIATIIAETNGFYLFKNQRQLVSYAGYDIVENQSGNSRGKTRISKKGNSHIRRALHMPSLCVVRYNPDSFARFYDRVYQSSKVKMKGYVAIQRKLLLLIYTLWKKDEVYLPKTSGKEEQTVLFSPQEKRNCLIKDNPSLDEHLYKVSQDVLFSQKQI